MYQFISGKFQNTAYAVAASRMGNLSKPIWCYSNQQINFTVFKSNNVAADTNPARPTILVTFDDSKSASTHLTLFDHFGCESV
jgi:hypothetical protein